MTEKPPVIAWFRQDLRLQDNPALFAAVETGAPLLPVYILDDENAGDWRMGAASRWWLHRSLESLSASLGGHLKYFCGDAKEILTNLVAETGASAVYWNRCYEPWRIDRDRKIKKELVENGVAATSRNGSLLFEPPTIAKKDGTAYRVFTPFYRRGCLESAAPREPRSADPNENIFHKAAGIELDALDLMPKIRWYDSIAAAWTPGEDGAHRRLQEFIDHGLADYKNGRDRPDKQLVSRLSPHLHFGEISPHTLWYAVKEQEAKTELCENIDHFNSELGWREFSHYILYHFPDLPAKNLQRKFNRFPWRTDDGSLHRWQRGQTGYPIVDAGMRELWQTGYMHNRVRMIVGSFLVKNLMLHWRHGEEWFWDTLVDADLANNSAGWQWIAGSGADAAPYFRIFNPVTQGNKFDPNGDYVRTYLPEIAALPNKYLHSPWTAPAEVLARAEIELGDTYPQPMVDLKETRERALAAFKSISGLSGKGQ